MKHDPTLALQPGFQVAPTARVYPRRLKRCFDLVCALLMLPVLTPLIGLLWLAVRMDGGNGFFRQPRVGFDGKRFDCWKLRTMVPDADAVLRNLCVADAGLRLEWERRQKIDDDPRITRIGQFLRASSLDELPQIWNVLRGEMSLVGPRPFMPAQEHLYRAAGGIHYFRVRPGITGLWQVSARNGDSFGDRVRYDRSYVQNIGFVGDVSLLVQTVGAVAAMSGR